MKIILPKTLVPTTNLAGFPLFFLAGPVRGGDDWQSRCAFLLEESLRDKVAEFHVAIPHRYENGHVALRHEAEGKEEFVRQLPWERHYLDLASGWEPGIANACILFWLPCESTVNPREDGPYAQDTYGELGWVRGMARAKKDLRVVIGAEPDFHGYSQIKRNAQADFGPDFRIYSSLEETVEAAIKKSGLAKT